MLMTLSFARLVTVGIRIGAERMRAQGRSTGRVTTAGVDYTRGGQA
jgi:hypothetical protein